MLNLGFLLVREPQIIRRPFLMILHSRSTLTAGSFPFWIILRIWWRLVLSMVTASLSVRISLMPRDPAGSCCHFWTDSLAALYRWHCAVTEHLTSESSSALEFKLPFLMLSYFTSSLLFVSDDAEIGSFFAPSWRIWSVTWPYVSKGKDAA